LKRPSTSPVNPDDLCRLNRRQLRKQNFGGGLASVAIDSLLESHRWDASLDESHESHRWEALKSLAAPP
jgi:hypothetical protein